jgi:hypothetical protein
LIQINPAISSTINSAVHKAGAIGRLGDAGTCAALAARLE